MRARILVATALVMALSVAAETPPVETRLKDQADVAVTAYNNGLALVRDVRKLTLPTGEIALKFMDVAAQIRPETVGLRSLSDAGSVAIVEQNYEYDLISPAKLMDKYVGKQVRLINFDTKTGFTEVIADLLSNNDGPVYKVGGQVFLSHPGTVVLPQLPENLIAEPSLVWRIRNTQADQQLEATYLTNGISWQADYVVTLARDDASLDLAGWVTLNNQSGGAYANAELKLVAGEVNIVREGANLNAWFLDAAVEKVNALGYLTPKEESFAEYHLYTMPRRTNIKQNESKQLALLSAAGVTCAKKYEYRGQESFYSGPVPQIPPDHVGVVLKFRNEEKNRLGMPLPAGVMRVYQEDSDRMLQFAGEDRIEHTPKDEEITLKMGNAFDVVAESVQKDFRTYGSVHEAAYEITLRNHKDVTIVVDVVEPIPGDWEIIEKSQAFEKKDARTAVFTVPVAANGEAKVAYRVRIKY